MASVTPVVDHWLEQEIAQWVHPIKDRSDDPPHHERTSYTSELHTAPWFLQATLAQLNKASQMKNGSCYSVFKMSYKFLFVL